MDSVMSLVPQPKIGLRVTILITVIVFALIGRAGPIATLVFCLTMLGLFGTFPRCRISSEQFEKEWFVVFLPIHSTHTCMADIRWIETDVEKKMGIEGGCLVTMFFGLETLLMVWLLDWLIPWAGGDYKIMLRTLSGDRILAWQGNGDANFRRNLEIMEEVSGLAVTRG